METRVVINIAIYILATLRAALVEYAILRPSKAPGPVYPIPS
jgi:hypothetical protein